MTDSVTPAASTRGRPTLPGFAGLVRLGKALMLPIAVLPAAGLLARLGQPDLLGRIHTPVIGPFFSAMSAAASWWRRMICTVIFSASGTSFTAGAILSVYAATAGMAVRPDAGLGSDWTDADGANV